MGNLYALKMQQNFRQISNALPTCRLGGWEEEGGGGRECALTIEYHLVRNKMAQQFLSKIFHPCLHMKKPMYYYIATDSSIRAEDC